MARNLKLEFEILSPLFMGGADQGTAELRPPSLKGLLRFWYRAIDPGFHERTENPGGQSLSREERCFGSQKGQAPFLLRLDQPLVGRLDWDRGQAASFSKPNPRTKLPLNGLVYLGYPFHMGTNNQGTPRRAIPPGRKFAVHCVFPREPTPKQRRSLAAAWWLLGHLGGAGSRARRGFGSLALTDWSADADWPELAELPPLHRSATAAEWEAGLKRGMERLRGWFGAFDKSSDRSPEHPHLGGSFRHHLMAKGFGQWDQALNAAGLELQEFRQCSRLDYEEVKAHAQGGRALRESPARVSFGLPLAFRFRSVRDARPLEFVPFDPVRGQPGERHGSLLMIRLVPLGGELHPLFLRLSGAVPGVRPQAVLRRQARPLLPPRENAMDLFMNELEKT